MGLMRNGIGVTRLGAPDDPTYYITRSDDRLPHMYLSPVEAQTLVDLMGEYGIVTGGSHGCPRTD